MSPRRHDHSMLGELEAQLRARWDDEERWAVYADALLASGDPRGELISLELRLARQPDDPELRAASMVLQAELAQGWTPPYAVNASRVSWSRGFVTGLRSIELSDIDEVSCLARVLDSSRLRMLRRLELRVHEVPEPELLPALVELEPGPIRALQVAHAPVGDELSLAPSLFPPTLIELDLRNTKLHDEALAALLERLPPLRRLSLQSNALGSDAAGRLASCRALEHLEHLDLRSNPLTAAGARKLAASGVLRSLKTLALDQRDIGVRGMEALAQAPALPPVVTRFWRARARQAQENRDP